jgi:hypothetical protein
MSKPKAKKAVKRRPGRAEMVRTKCAAAALATVEGLGAQLGMF